MFVDSLSYRLNFNDKQVSRTFDTRQGVNDERNLYPGTDDEVWVEYNNPGTHDWLKIG